MTLKLTNASHIPSFRIFKCAFPPRTRNEIAPSARIQLESAERGEDA